MIIELNKYAVGGRLLGTRQLALPIRDLIENSISKGDQVDLDFSDTNPTQSFIDELVGALIMDHGSRVLDLLIMKNCSEDIKSILHFVVSDRLDQMQGANID